MLRYSMFSSLTADLGWVQSHVFLLFFFCFFCFVHITCVCLHKHSQVGCGVRWGYSLWSRLTVARPACDLSTSGLQFVPRRVFTGSPRNTISALWDGQKRKWTESLSQSSLGNHLVVRWCPDPTHPSRWENHLLLCSGAGVTQRGRLRQGGGEMQSRSRSLVLECTVISPNVAVMETARPSVLTGQQV